MDKMDVYEQIEYTDRKLRIVFRINRISRRLLRDPTYLEKLMGSDYQAYLERIVDPNVPMPSLSSIYGNFLHKNPLQKTINFIYLCHNPNLPSILRTIGRTQKYKNELLARSNDHLSACAHVGQRVVLSNAQ